LHDIWKVLLLESLQSLTDTLIARSVAAEPP
jgi:hypothetical protein